MARRGSRDEVLVGQLAGRLERLGYDDIEFQGVYAVVENIKTFRFFGFTDDHMVIDVIQNVETSLFEIWDCIADEDNFVRQEVFYL